MILSAHNSVLERSVPATRQVVAEVLQATVAARLRDTLAQQQVRLPKELLLRPVGFMKATARVQFVFIGHFLTPVFED